MQLEGRLSSFPLRELLELSAVCLVTGAIEIQAPAGVHRLFVVQGVLVHVWAANASGFEALWPLFELNDAAFRFIPGAVAVERTIMEPLRGLIARAEALAQEWSKIRPFVPCLEIVPKLTTPAQTDHVRIFEEDWPLLSMVDGARTITEVAQAAQLDVLEVCGGLLRLKERGLVSLSQQREAHVEPDSTWTSPTRDLSVPQQSVSQRGARAGFFAKLLMELPADLCKQYAPKVAAISEAPALLPPGTDTDDILRLLRS